ncbi:hypothetical protein P12x_000993 [Tundrisphaera lichenicola]|uniref:hypothetical protein n=1 Tax=Tundrisphaera lichenicola TaxID=2029860 RepID=UPI003EBD6066
MSAVDPNPRSEPGLLRRTIRHRLVPMFCLWLAGTIVLCAASLRYIRPYYRATSLIQVSEPAEDLYGVRGDDENMAESLNTLVQLIRNPGVLQAAAASPKASSLRFIQESRDVVIDLETYLSVRVIPTTSLIEVSMTSNESYEAATLVNAVVDAFMNSNKLLANAGKKSQIDALQEYKKGLEEKSAAIEAKWRSLVGKGNADPQVVIRDQANDEEGAARTVSLDIFRGLEHELFSVSLALAEAEANLRFLTDASTKTEQAPASPATAATLIAEVDLRLKANGELGELAARLKEARDHREELAAKAEPEDPALVEASQKIEALLFEYDKEFAGKAKPLLDESAEATDRASELKEAQTRVRLLKIKQETLRAQFDRLEVKNQDQTADTVSIAMVLEERESLRAMQEAVNKRIEQFTFESKGEARISVVDQATPPGKPYVYRGASFLVMVALFMLPISFTFFLMVEALVGRRRDPFAEV